MIVFNFGVKHLKWQGLSWWVELKSLPLPSHQLRSDENLSHSNYGLKLLLFPQKYLFFVMRKGPAYKLIKGGWPSLPSDLTTGKVSMQAPGDDCFIKRVQMMMDVRGWSTRLCTEAQVWIGSLAIWELHAGGTQKSHVHAIGRILWYFCDRSNMLSLRVRCKGGRTPIFGKKKNPIVREME